MKTQLTKKTLKRLEAEQARLTRRIEQIEAVLQPPKRTVNSGGR
jgi:hypothetical protein